MQAKSDISLTALAAARLRMERDEGRGLRTDERIVRIANAGIDVKAESVDQRGAVKDDIIERLDSATSQSWRARNEPTTSGEGRPRHRVQEDHGYALVTGVAGFVGSHLADALLAEGHTVRGVDCFTPYYDPQGKWANVAGLLERPGFQLTQADLRTEALEPLVADADLVFHQAGQPGVRLSWSDGFPAYVEHNVLATQRLLEAVRTSRVRRFVFASSSSVYGNAVRYPTRESDLPRPYSPYGVTKLAAEQLCCLYAANWGIPTVSLRYFTVYGPRQRPDMGIHRFIEAALDGRPIPLYGDGEQVRDFTFVDDVVRANLAAARRDVEPGTVLNVAGGGSVTVNQLLALIETSVGVPIEVTHLPEQPGDVRITGGAVDKAVRHLGWSPRVGVAEGVASQVAWHRERRSELGLVSTSTLETPSLMGGSKC